MRKVICMVHPFQMIIECCMRQPSDGEKNFEKMSLPQLLDYQGCTSHHIRVDKLERSDLELLIDRIIVYEDHLEIKLQSDIDTLLRCEAAPQIIKYSPRGSQQAFA